MNIPAMGMDTGCTTSKTYVWRHSSIAKKRESTNLDQDQTSNRIDSKFQRIQEKKFCVNAERDAHDRDRLLASEWLIRIFRSTIIDKEDRRRRRYSRADFLACTGQTRSDYRRSVHQWSLIIRSSFGRQSTVIRPLFDQPILSSTHLRHYRKILRRVLISISAKGLNQFSSNLISLFQRFFSASS